MRKPISKNDNRKFYDEAFAEVFTNRQIVESLLRDFVGGDWKMTGLMITLMKEVKV